MPTDFDSKDILLIYGHFIKKIRQLEEIKGAPNNPVAIECIDHDIALYSSITDKIRKLNPNLVKLNKMIK